MHYRKNIAAFSLIEVVMSLGIFVFAGAAVVELLAVGLQSNRDSKQQLQAATIAEYLCSTRRAVPITDISSTGTGAQPKFALPPLTKAVVTGNVNNISPLSPVYLTWEGAATTLANNDARFGLLYSIIAPTTYVTSISPGTATVYLYIWWPARAQATAANTAHLDLTTTMALP